MALKARIKSKFPARVVESTGINITKSGGVYTFAWDISGITEKTSITSGERDNIFIPVYDTDNSHYRLVDIDTLLTTMVAGLDATLTAIAALTPIADQGIYFSAPDTAAVYSLTAGGRALAGTTAASDKLAYYTGSSTATTTDFTAFGRSLIDDADAPAGRATLELASTTTDNAISRYHSTAGATQNSGVLIDDSNNIAPVTTDTGALGTSLLMWSDLFLAPGGVINFNAGNYTITHTAGDLAFSGIVTLINTGLHLLDTNASHDLIIKPGSDLAADRTFTLTTGDADRTLVRK